MRDCQDCGKPFEPLREHARFCSTPCRVRWNKRNARHPAEPSAASRGAAIDLARLVGAYQVGKITRGEYAAAAVTLINGQFTSVNEALLALGGLAWEAMCAAEQPERETV